jgi:hypothetical protein
MTNQKIAAAFVKAQSQFGAALKTSINPAFARGGNKGAYAGLDSCIDAVIGALNANGIALMQPTHECDNGILIETIFMHESGEILSNGKLHVPSAKQDAQGYGSALTYARRYSLMAACGLAPEDDDGNAAVKQPKAKPAEIAEVKPASAKPVPQDVFDNLDSITQDTIRSYAMNAISFGTIKNDTAKCFQYIESLKLDADLYAALWSQLDSKLRASLKAYKEIKNVVS